MHTPGPWWTDGARVNSADGYFVADVSYAWRSADEASANANLIAAAPDLLAALELAVGIVDRLVPFVHQYEHDAEKAIRSAIAKAKGE